MHILVLNPGSSSIKFSMHEVGEGARVVGEGARAKGAGEIRTLYEGELGGIGGRREKLVFHDAAGKDLSGRLGTVKPGSMQEAIAVVERAVGLDGLPPPDAVGYRVVHPGAHLRGHQRLTPEVLAELRAAVPFAPLHDPEALAMIGEMMRRFADVPHIACFDTVFHETMPEEATVYALPYAVRRQGVRRYGFHGLSCESVVAQMREAVGVEFPRSMLIAHLGSGCSVTACIEGKSVDNTMGLTPTGGVMMGTRTGDLDPGVVLFLMRQAGATADSVERMIDGDAGLRALGGVNDMRELRRRAAEGNARARLAIRVFCRTVVKAIAGFIALHGADAIVFTGGIGEGDAASRGEIAGALRGLGVELDPAANKMEQKASGQSVDSPARQSVRKISDEDSPTAVYVVPAEEDRMIARHVARMCHTAAGGEAQIS
jgi:acetate kinase